VVVLNAGEEQVTVSVDLGERIAGHLADAASQAGVAVPRLRDLVTGGAVNVARQGDGASVTVTLPPLAGSVFAPEVANILSPPHSDK
jgi:hypothetical protein